MYRRLVDIRLYFSVRKKKGDLASKVCTGKVYNLFLPFQFDDTYYEYDIHCDAYS